MANKGEWSEPYVAIRILGEKRLYIADNSGNKNINEWMNVIELIRRETSERIVKYNYSVDDTIINIYINDDISVSVEAVKFLKMADKLAEEIQNGNSSSFNVTSDIQAFLEEIEIKHIKAQSINKSDVFLTLRDPRCSIVRENIGFSIKSEFGKDPTLFNTAKASATVYEISNMDDALMNEINNIVDNKGNVAVSKRCDKLIEQGCELLFVGFPVAQRARCAAFAENLDLIDPRLAIVIERLLWNHFFNHTSCVNITDVIEAIIEENPCGLTRPEIKYPYMIKSFLYASYCGMTASTVWDGRSQVNGGLIKVNSSGEVLAYYALESDSFKTYLYNNCYLEFPSTGENHGNYAKVYKENDKYYFRLNFQIRYR